MLPNRIVVSAATEEKLKREKSRTGQQPNIMVREAFFSALEKEIRIQDLSKFSPGTMSMDKKTWLGETEITTELILNQLYPELSHEDKAKAWALTVEIGI